MRGVVIDMKDISDSREVMESKTPKVITVFTMIIFAVLTAFVIWACVYEHEKYFSASGQISTSRSASIVTSQMGGMVDEILIDDGQLVYAGDVILVMDNSDVSEQQQVLTDIINELNQKIEYNEKLKECVLSGSNMFLQSGDEASYYYQYEQYRNELDTVLSQLYQSELQMQNTVSDANADISVIEQRISENELMIGEYNRMADAIQNYQCFASSNSLIMSLYNSYSVDDSNLAFSISGLNESCNQLANEEYTEEIQVRMDGINAEISELNNQRTALATNYILDIRSKVASLENENITLENNLEKLRISIDSQSSYQSEEMLVSQAQINMLAQINSNIEALEVQIAEYKLQLTSVNQTAAATEIRASETGRIMFTEQLASGNMVQASAAVAKIIPENSSMKVTLYLPDTYISEVTIGQKVEYEVHSLQYSGLEKLDGKIISISPDAIVNETTGAVYYKAEASISQESVEKLPEGSNSLRSGMTLSAHIITNSEKVISTIWNKIKF